MKNYAIEAQSRDRAGKGIARSLRREGRTPAVVYGDKKEPVLISVDTNNINTEYNRGHMLTTLCDLTVDGKKQVVIARDVQLHPVTDVVEHVDFLRVSRKTKVAVSVPVHFVGQDDAPGIQNKGILNVIRFEVELNCSATHIPEQIDVNIASKEIGDAIKISDAVLPKDVTPVIDDRDFTIATIDAPKAAAAEDEEETEGAEEAAEGEASEEA